MGMENGFAEGYAVGQGNGGFGMNDWGDLAALIVVAGLFGWGGNGFGGGFGGGRGGFGYGNGISENYALATDFATIERKIDGVNNGLCDGFYAMNTGMLNGFAGVQQTLSQGFAGLNTGIVTQGYESRLGTQSLGAQLASCCCDLKQGQSETRYADLLNSKAIQEQIASCCCANEKSLMQLNYNIAQQNCATLTAIDKLGDRIIGHLDATEKQNLRDENFALKLSASQEKQNNYLTAQMERLNPNRCPEPAYIVPNPNCCYQYGVNGFGYGYGTPCGSVQ